MKRLVLSLIVAASSLGLIAGSGITAAAAPASSGPVATATYTITYTCTAGPGCTVGTGYVHTYSISVLCGGTITGTGTQPGSPDVQETLTGAVVVNESSSTVGVQYVSTYTGPLAPGYTVTFTGTLDPRTGALTGTATAGLPGDPSTNATFAVQGVRNSFSFDRSACSGDPGDSAGEEDGGGEGGD